MENLPILYVFDKPTKGFQVFTIFHDTESEEFGSIKEEGSNATSKRFVYSLLNPEEKVKVTFLCNEGGIISLHSKLADLSVKQIQMSKKGKLLTSYSVFVLAVAASVVSLFSSAMADKLKSIVYVMFRAKTNENSR